MPDKETNTNYKRDSWKNALTGLGRRGYDKTENTLFQGDVLLSDVELTDIYIEDGLGHRIVHRPAQDATRRWLTIEGDEQLKVQKELNRIRAQKHTQQAIAWARLYGGSMIIMNIDDGRLLEEPVAPLAVKSIKKLKVYARPQIRINREDIDQDPESEFFEEPMTFTIQPLLAGSPFVVHRSRVLIFKGMELPRISEAQKKAYSDSIETWYWGLSALYPVYTALKNLLSSMAGLSHTMQELVISVYKLDGLAQQVATGHSQIIYDRMDIIQTGKSCVNGVFLDPSEAFERNEISLSGADAVIDKLILIVSGTSGIPVTLLFGRSPSGLNATGELDITNYYDDIAGLQQTEYGPAIQPMLDYIGVYENVDTSIIIWQPLYEPSEKEILDNRKIQSEIDKVYNLDLGAISDDELRDMRFLGGYSTEMGLPEDAGMLEEEEELEEEPIIEENEPVEDSILDVPKKKRGDFIRNLLRGGKK